MTSPWYYSINGKAIGPVTKEQLIGIFRQPDNPGPETFVFNEEETTSKWIKVTAINGLLSIVKQPPPPPPPPPPPSRPTNPVTPSQYSPSSIQQGSGQLPAPLSYKPEQRSGSVPFAIVMCMVIGLFVLAFIGIITMVLPALQKARARPMISYCVGNMKQLGTGSALYEGDNQCYPGPQPMGTAITAVSWDRPLASQMGANLGSRVYGVYESFAEPLANLTVTPRHASAKTLAIFTCPNDPQVMGSAIGTGAKTIAEGLAPGNNITRSYVLNLGSAKLTDVKDGVGFTDAAIPAAKIESFAGTVYLIESHGYATVFGQASFGPAKIAGDQVIVCSKGPTSLDPADSFTNRQVPMHGAKSRPRFNALMYDGHVETFEADTVTGNGSQVMQYVK
jgi:prepilin-type processing-associated H-X9-DG protein